MILVTGATGKLGSATLKELVQLVPKNEVLAMSRTAGENTSPFKTVGVEVRSGNYSDLDSLRLAFRNVDTLFFVSSAEAFVDKDLHGNVVKAAVETNIRHVVYTSTQRNHPLPTTTEDLGGDIHGWTELELMRSGLSYTILRNAPYLESVPLILGTDVLTKGFAMPFGNGKISFASREDMAVGSARILAAKFTSNRTLNFGGPRSLSMAEIVRDLSEISGREIPFSTPDDDTFAKTWRTMGFAEELIQGQLQFSKQVRSGYFDNPTEDLRDLLDREMVSVRNILREAYSL